MDTVSCLASCGRRDGDASFVEKHESRIDMWDERVEKSSSCDIRLGAFSPPGIGLHIFLPVYGEMPFTGVEFQL